MAKRRDDTGRAPRDETWGIRQSSEPLGEAALEIRLDIMVRLVTIQIISENESLGSLIDEMRSMHPEDDRDSLVRAIRSYLEGSSWREIISPAAKICLELLLDEAMDTAGQSDDIYEATKATVVRQLGVMWASTDLNSFDHALTADLAAATTEPLDFVGTCLRSEVALRHALAAAREEPLLLLSFSILLTRYMDRPQNVYYRARLASDRLTLNALLLDLDDRWKPFSHGVRCRVFADMALAEAASGKAVEAFEHVMRAEEEFAYARDAGYLSEAFPDNVQFPDTRAVFDPTEFFIKPILNAADAMFVIGGHDKAIELFAATYATIDVDKATDIAMLRRAVVLR